MPLPVFGMKWILLMFAIFPDESTILIKGKVTFPTEVACLAKGEEIGAFLMARTPGIRVRINCSVEEPLPGEHA